MGMFEGIVVPRMVYGCKVCALDEDVQLWIDVLKMKCLKTVCDVKWFDQVNCKRVRERYADKNMVKIAGKGWLK